MTLYGGIVNHVTHFLTPCYKQEPKGLDGTLCRQEWERIYRWREWDKTYGGHEKAHEVGWLTPNVAK